ncbi:FAD-dependent oxidoreductase [Mycobacterium sp. MYCO198283]|uniref:FAD-dependent oxidoreductase n=1 Tax=Mycobacterium sp. MYCO198283 TaxID=2883505 RepID=UPI001E586564|nr:FAD-dependent oxidoreductase [Mycobacterium sp. MYCO198283]MCG5434479.1 FAD-dependent oxidoreductase [Mycobacterium sp. MYCO198283]
MSAAARIRDARRVLHPGPVGLPDAGRLPARPRAVVVGGGIAGLAAATALAERGVTVDVVERAPYLGGRVGGWTETLGDGQTVAMNRGFHAFFRQYYNLRELLRRTDPGLTRLTPVDDYPLVDGHGRRDTFRGLPQTPPWNALAFALRSPTFRLRDLVRVDGRAAVPLATVSVPDIYQRLDDIDAASFLRQINFPDAAQHLAFEVFSRSFFSRPAELSAAELAAMFHIYFLGSNEGLIFDVATDNFDAALWEPLRAYLSGRGVTVHTDRAVDAVEPGTQRRFRVRCDGGDLDADGVVLAADIAGLQRIVDASPELGDAGWRATVAGLRTAPPFVVQRLWLDRPVHADRPAFLGTGGLEPLDNVSVVNRYEQQAAQWAQRHDGAVVELHAYSAPDDTAEVCRRLVGRLHALYPETAAAKVVGEVVLRREDCPQFGPGDFARRPGVATADPALALAGDGIRIDLPVALMERAATTGFAAANRLLSHWGLAGHSLQTVPVGGRSPRVSRLLARGAEVGAR